MNQRPLALTIFSICILAVALSIPLQIIYLQDFEQVKPG